MVLPCWRFMGAGRSCGAWLLLASLLAPFNARDGDNQLKCLCLADELLFARQAAELQLSEGKRGNPQAPPPSPIELLAVGVRNKRAPTADDEGALAYEEEGERENKAASNLTNDLRASKWQLALEAPLQASNEQQRRRTATVTTPKTTATSAIIDNQEAAWDTSQSEREKEKQEEEEGEEAKELEDDDDETNPLIEQHATQASHYDHQLVAAGAAHMRRPAIELGDASFLLSPARRGRRECPSDQSCQHAGELARGRKLLFCASNKRIYSSMCAMRKEACELGISLHRMRSIAYCRQPVAPLEPLEAWPALKLESHSLPPPPPPPLQRPQVGDTTCLRGSANYAKFKEALWREFSGNLALLFKHLDANGNQLIEARELWPHQAEVASHQKPSTCHLNDDDDAALDCEREFAFEPHFSWSSCALSHLMVFELTHENATFSWPTFKEAFNSLDNQEKQAQNEPKLQLEFANSNGAQNPAAENQVKTIRQTDTTNVQLKLGDSRRLQCLSRQLDSDLKAAAAQVEQNSVACAWWRHGVNLASLRDQPHVQLLTSESNQLPLELEFKEAQLYLSGTFECVCHVNPNAQLILVHKYQIQVTAPAHVSVRPRQQWSPPNSRVSFECQHEFIDTNPNGLTNDAQIEWLKVDGEEQENQRELHHLEQRILDSTSGESQTASNLSSPSGCSPRATISLASSRLALENLQLNDTGAYKCRLTGDTQSSLPEAAFDFGRLLVREQPPISSRTTAAAAATTTSKLPMISGGRNRGQMARHLWHFHAEGISVFELIDEQLELVRHLSGRERVSARVDGNWNQLTLCGGVAPEQAVICEWSDNALELRVPAARGEEQINFREEEDEEVTLNDERSRSFIYVGQPNLNRLLVLDGRALTIVAVVNTEPQPRRLFAYRPNKIHLNKWVRRRLSPLANARWLQAIGQLRAHPLELTPKKSRSYSDKRQDGAQDAAQEEEEEVDRKRATRNAANNWRKAAPKLVQHDIWLLCYGQPLVVDPASESAEGDELNEMGAFETSAYNNNNNNNKSTFDITANENMEATNWQLNNGGGGPTNTPMQAHYWRPVAQRLRNRKSIQIIQSTFFERPRRRQHAHHMHANQQQQDHEHSDSTSGGGGVEEENNFKWQEQEASANNVELADEMAVNEFKRLSVLTTHYVMAARMREQLLAARRGRRELHLNEEEEEGALHLKALQELLAQDLLVQDLSVPSRPEWLVDETRFQLHYAYATHFAGRQLSRISMDSYQFERQQIDLLNCRPSNLLATHQGQLVIQCGGDVKTHQPPGQLVLDELTGARMQFNANICAQASYLSPDSRYLVSVFTNQTAITMPAQTLPTSNSSATEIKRDFKRSTIIYVQQVSVNGLALQYEIKTALEIVQCAFVWKDGYYAAIFVALNRRDQQSELLSLRLADSRLELMVRLPGLVASTPSALKHRQPLNVLDDLKLAALSTSEATYIVDLDENRIIQTLAQHHQSSPTLLWT